MLAPWKKKKKTMINLNSILKKQRHYFTDKGPSSQTYGFSSQESWSELPFPTPWDLPNTGIQAAFLGSPALADRFFTTEQPESKEEIRVKLGGLS